MTPRITQAIILAAGRGKRLGAVTNNTPKPLLLLAGIPLLYHTLKQLERSEIQRVVVNCGYLGEQVAHACTEYRRTQPTPLEIHCSIEGYPTLDTGGGIMQAWTLLQDEAVLVINADILLLHDLRQFTLPHNSLAHLLLVPQATHQAHADFALHQNGTLGVRAPSYSFSGASLLHPALRAYAPEGARFPLREWLLPAVAANKVTGEVFHGTWMDLGTQERLAHAEAIMRGT